VEHNIARPAPVHRDAAHFLLGRAPVAQAAPDHRRDAGESGRAADYAVDDADRTIGDDPGTRRRAQAQADE